MILIEQSALMPWGFRLSHLAPKFNPKKFSSVHLSTKGNKLKYFLLHRFSKTFAVISLSFPLFQRSHWFRETPEEKKETRQFYETNESKYFEAEPTDLVAGIQIKHLCKVLFQNFFLPDGTEI